MTAPAASKGFILLIASMISLVAMSIDAILPALVHIASDFSLSSANQAQWTITALFIGLSIGQLLYGPWSDAIGRKKPIYAGYALFVIGSLLCLFSSNFTVLLIGRVLQGMGAAAPRIVTTALIRDSLKGVAMARVMSVVMSVFIVVPVFAPALGQLILDFSHWRSIFLMLLLMAVVTGIVFYWRQPETLAIAQRRPLNWQTFSSGFKLILADRHAVTYTVISGLVFGVFMGYLNSSAQIFIHLYQQGGNFAWLFALAAASVGVASLVNGRWVVHFGMVFMVKRALWGILIMSSLFTVLVWFKAGVPLLWQTMIFLMIVFFFIGILFGNLNALAMETLGDLAGMGSAFVASVSTVIGIVIGSTIGQSFNLTLYPLTLGFLLVSAASLLLVKRLN